MGGAESTVAGAGTKEWDESSPSAAHSIHSLDYAAPLGNRGHKRASLFSLKCEMQKMY